MDVFKSGQALYCDKCYSRFCKSTITKIKESADVWAQCFKNYIPEFTLLPVFNALSNSLSSVEYFIEIMLILNLCFWLINWL